MKFLFEDIQVSTEKRTELVDITRKVEEATEKSKVTNGMCLIHSVHSTTAIVVNEHEAGLTSDILKKIQHDFPKGAGWLHDRVDDNADAHLAASYLGPTAIFPVRSIDMLDLYNKRDIRDFLRLWRGFLTKLARTSRLEPKLLQNQHTGAGGGDLNQKKTSHSENLPASSACKPKKVGCMVLLGLKTIQFSSQIDQCVH